MMDPNNYAKVRKYLQEIPGLEIIETIESDEISIVTNPSDGISRLVVDCEPDILILEHVLMPMPDTDGAARRLLEMNADLVHGAYMCIDTKLIWKDTLAIANLDFNELQSSINALSLGIAEHRDELLTMGHSG